MKKEDVGLILLVILFISVLGYGIFVGFGGKENSDQKETSICDVNPNSPLCGNNEQEVIANDNTPVVSNEVQNTANEASICDINPSSPLCSTNEVQNVTQESTNSGTSICDINPNSPLC